MGNFEKKANDQKNGAKKKYGAHVSRKTAKRETENARIFLAEGLQNRKKRI